MISNKIILWVALVASVFGLTQAYSWHKREVEAARSFIISEYDKGYVLELEEQLKQSSAFLEAYGEQVRGLNGKVYNITVERDALIDSVRKRSNRQSKTAKSVPNDTASCANTGRELSREDAEFLIGESSIADVVREERDFYYNTLVEYMNRMDLLND